MCKMVCVIPLMKIKYDLEMSVKVREIMICVKSPKQTTPRETCLLLTNKGKTKECIDSEEEYTAFPEVLSSMQVTCLFNEFQVIYCRLLTAYNHCLISI